MSEIAGEAAVRIGTGPWARATSWIMHFMRSKPLGGVSAVIVVVMAAVALFAPMLAVYDPIEVSSQDKLQPPNVHHLMGTDEAGRDVWSRVIWGARVTLYVTTLAVALSTVASGSVGIISGHFGGAVDAVIQRFVDAIMSFPFLVLMLTLMMLFGNSMTNLAFGLGIVFGIRNSRVIRSEVLKLKETQYIEAARAIGCGNWRIMLVHLLPNTFAPLIVIATLNWGNAILTESALSFLGFGVPPPDPSWGRMISDSGTVSMESAPWIGIFPGMAIVLSVFAFNMLGDSLRDVLDPRMRGE